MKEGKRAVVVGHTCIDITPVFPQEKVEDASKILKPGRLISMNGVTISTGGAVPNTGLALKKMGVDVALMGKIGSDDFGKLLLDLLDKHQVAESMIVDEDADTSYTVVLAIPGVDRIFLHDSGANDTFTFDDLEFSKIENATLLHFGYPPIMREMYQNDGEQLIKIMKKIKGMNVATSLDMAAMDPNAEVARKDWEKILEGTLPFVDFFVPSFEELCFIMDRDNYERLVERAAGKDINEIITLADVEPLAKRILDMGAKVAMIKCGAAGIYYQTAKKEEIEELCQALNLPLDGWAGKKGFEASYIPERIASGTGAGDTCIAAFIASVLEENTVEQSVRLAGAEGACCVETYDALSGIRSLSELEAKIQNGWKKNKDIV